jgi:hypothetical protein
VLIKNKRKIVKPIKGKDFSYLLFLVIKKIEMLIKGEGSVFFRRD